MSSKPRKGSNRARSNGGAKKATKSQVKIGFNGTRFTPAADPTAIVGIPWWQLVIKTTVKVGGSVVVYDNEALVSDFQKQTGMDISIATNEVCFRITSVSIWETTGKSVGLYPYDWNATGGKTDVLANLVDTPGRNQWARIGYKWPASFQTQVLDTSGGEHPTNLFAFDARDPLVSNATAPGNVVIHIHVLFKRRVLSRPTVLYTTLKEYEIADSH